jgi:peptidoglycan/xylan/chitin deacetylase (PgdA/CDA1 family)
MQWLLLIPLLLALLWLLGNYTFWMAPRPRRLPRLLMYHDTSDGPGSGMNIAPDRLMTQIQWMKNKGHRFVKVSELLDRESENCVAITLDDGFASNYRELFPRLRKENIPCTIYLAPHIEGIDRLTPEQISEMQASGLVEFGAHTLHHINLKNCSDEQARQEINDSKQAVAALSGAPCNSFSYPFGRFEERHVEMVRAAGFTSAVTVKKAILPITDPFRLPRIGINGAANRLQFHLAFTRGRYKL